MNVKQAKILLEKINRLFQSMTMDEHISEIEKELMRNYIKSLYEEFMPKNGVQTTPIVEAPKVVAPKPVQKVVAPVVETPPPAPKVVIEKPKPNPVVETPPAPKAVVKQVAPSPPPPPPPVVKATPQQATAPIPPKTKKAKINEDMEELFEHKEAKELSERLSSAPIKDLRKAMGINERILTTNELFDGNGDALKDALSTINNLSNFEEAKEYLANIGDIYDWTIKKKRKKAKIFIKLIRRRFS